MAEQPPLLIVSNRGPVRFSRGPDGELVAARGGGGLVTALSGLAAARPVTWIASALTDEDAEVAARGPHHRRRPHRAPRGPRPRGVRPLLQRLREPDAVVHPPLPVGARVGAVGRSQRAPGLGRGLRPGQPGLRRRGRGGARAGRGRAAAGDAAGLPPLRRAGIDPRAGAGRRHPALHPHPVAACRTTGGCCRPTSARPSTSRCWPATWSACTPRATSATSCTASSRVHRRPRRPRDAHRAPPRPHHPRPRLSRSRSTRPSSTGSARARRCWRSGRRCRRGGPSGCVLRVDRTDPSKNVVRGIQAFELFLSDHPEWEGPGDAAGQARPLAPGHPRVRRVPGRDPARRPDGERPLLRDRRLAGRSTCASPTTSPRRSRPTPSTTCCS